MWSNPPLFESSDWRFLSTTLLKDISAVKIHTRDPLLSNSDLGRKECVGDFVSQLLKGQRYIDPDQVVLVTLLGFPTTMTQSAESLRRFREPAAQYDELLRRVLSAHIREHGEAKSSEIRRKAKETHSEHVDRLLQELNLALDWMLAEEHLTNSQHTATEAAQSTADKLLQRVFDIPDDRRLMNTVKKFRRYIFHELFRAVSNFMVRYLFTVRQETTPSVSEAVRRLPKKLFVSVWPLAAPGVTMLQSRGVCSRAVRWDIDQVANLAMHGPVDSIAWNAVHSGTSELVPLMLNLFGFDDHTEAIMMRCQRDEAEIHKGFTLLQRDLENYFESKRQQSSADVRPAAPPSTQMGIFSISAVELYKVYSYLVCRPQYARQLRCSLSLSRRNPDRTRWSLRDPRELSMHLLSLYKQSHAATMSAVSVCRDPSPFSSAFSLRLCIPIDFCNRYVPPSSPGDAGSHIFRGLVIEWLSLHEAMRQPLTQLSLRLLRERRRSFSLLQCDDEQYLNADGKVGCLVMLSQMINDAACHWLPMELIDTFLNVIDSLPVDVDSLLQILPDVDDRLSVISATIRCQERCIQSNRPCYIAVRCVRLWQWGFDHLEHQRQRSMPSKAAKCSCSVVVHGLLLKRLVPLSRLDYSGLRCDARLLESDARITPAERRLLQTHRSTLVGLT